MKNLLMAAFLLATPLAAFAQTDDSDLEARTRVLLNGAEIRQTLVPTLSSLSLASAPGVILTSEGLLCQQYFGYGFVAWNNIVMVVRTTESIDISVGDPLQQQYLSIPTTSSRPPYLEDPEGFFKALILRGDLVHSEGAYTPRENAQPPEGPPVVFAYKGSEAWSQGWDVAELTKLPSTPGVTVNTTGIAQVTPNQVQSLRWEELVTVTSTPADLENSQGASLEVEGKEHSLTFHYPDAFDLSAPDFQNLVTLLEKGRDGLEAPVFFPLRTKSLYWVDPADSASVAPEARFEPLPPGASWWPSGIDKAGLYLLPEGLMEVDKYVVRRVAWPLLQDLSGDVYGLLNITVHSYPLWISPMTVEEVPAYLSFREDVRATAGLVGTGEEVYVAPKTRQGESAQRGYYPLSEASSWRGLPLSTLGDSPWQRGLYLLPEGLVSIEEQRLALTPWEDFTSLTVVDTEDGHSLIHSATKGQRHGIYPPGALHGETLLKLSAKDVEKALKAYVKLHHEGTITISEKRPTQTVRLEYLDVPQD